ncbi:MAG: PAS domain-containing protein [Balneolaceae bacterium]
MALLWILLSDLALEWVIKNPLLLSTFQTIKGFLFVTITGSLLYLLIQVSNKKIYSEKQQIENALEAANMAVWSVDIKTGKIVPSKKDYELFGFKNTPSAWSVEIFLNSIHPDDKEKVRQSYENSIENEAPYNTEYRVLWPDESIHWMQSRGTIKKDKKGEPAQLIGVVADVTERKKLEEDYRREKELFERIFDASLLMIDVFDPEVNYIRVNRAFEEIMGWTKEELPNLDLMESAYPDEKIRKKALYEMEKADGTWHEYVVRTKNNEKRIQRWANIKLSNDVKIGLGLDITEEKKLEKKLEKESIELQKTKERYQKAEQIANIGHWQRNIKTDEAIWSDGYYKVIEVDKNSDRTSFEDLLEMIHPDDRDSFQKAFNNALKTGFFNFQYRLQKQKSGKIGYYHSLGEVEYNKQGEAWYISGTLHDITELKKAEQNIQKEKRRFELVANSSSDVIWDYDISNDKVWWSEGFEEYFGYKIKNLPKDISSWSNYIHPDDLNRLTKSLNSSLESNDNYWREEYRFICADGSIAFVIDYGTIIRNENGEAIQMVGTINDVTDKKRAKERLMESEKKYRQLFKQIPHPMWIYDLDSLKFVEVNEAAVHHYGYNEEEFLAMTIADIRPKKDVETLLKVVNEHIESNKASYSNDWIHLKKDGSKINVAISSSNIKLEKKQYRIVLAIDITKQKKAEERVIASLVEGENRERKRLSQELHDGLGQYLAAANMNLDAMKDSITGLSELKHQQFLKGINFLKHAIIETRSISHNLMPRAVDDYGLPLALEALIDNYQNSTDITYFYYQNLGDTKLSNEIAINLYRIVQEALSNAIKHAEANKINVQLIKDDLELILTIDDNGKGFDITAPEFKKGLGLKTMKTRTDALSGVLDVETKPGKGTLLNVIIPIGTSVNKK